MHAKSDVINNKMIHSGAPQLPRNNKAESSAHSSFLVAAGCSEEPIFGVTSKQEGGPCLKECSVESSCSLACLLPLTLLLPAVLFFLTAPHSLMVSWLLAGWLLCSSSAQLAPQQDPELRLLLCHGLGEKRPAPPALLEKAK